jgi:HTH-type transcriptional regulator/antitoxin HigA
MGGNIRPYIAIGPGAHIREEMEERSWNEAEFSDILGISEKHLSEILNEKTPMTITMARLIAKAFGTTPQMWMNLYLNYIEDKSIIEKSSDEDLHNVEIKKEIYNIMPVNDMTKKGWIPKRSGSAELLICLKNIWGTNDIAQILKVIKAKPLASFRKTEKDGFSRNYTQTWLKIAENISASIEAPLYKSVMFEKICDSANEYTIRKDGVGEFLRDIKKAGVKFFVLPHLKKTYIDGAAFMHKKNPVIVYTDRYDRIDNFWFTIIHESGHIIKHLKEKSKHESFIDDLSHLEGLKEKEADDFSKEKLKINKILKRYEESFNNRLSWITTVSNELHISSAVIVGSLQKAKKLTYRSTVLSAIKESVIEKITKDYIPDVTKICKYS